MGLSNITWSSELGLGQIIILIAYIIGYLIIYFHQKNKIGVLKEQIDTQKGILEQVERYMSIFDLDKVEKFVEISDKTVQMEKEEAIKKIEAKAKSNHEYLFKDYEAVYKALIGLVYALPYLPVLERTVNDMENVLSKEIILGGLNQARRNWESHEIGREGWIVGFIASLRIDTKWGEKLSKDK